MKHESASEGLSTGAKVIITLLVISAVVALAAIGVRLINKGSEKANKLGDTLDVKAYTDIDGNTNYSGSDVREFMTEHMEDTLGGQIVLTVDLSATGKTNTVLDGSAAVDTVGEMRSYLSHMNNQTDGQYVNPSAKFTVTVVYRSDGTISGCTFKQN